nr:Biopolymer transport protein exbB [Klebsiella pneumoniae]
MGNNLMQADLSVWGMYHHADIVVKVVMIGLILASVVTWAIFFGKGRKSSPASVASNVNSSSWQKPSRSGQRYRQRL